MIGTCGLVKAKEGGGGEANSSEDTKEGTPFTQLQFLSPESKGTSVQQLPGYGRMPLEATVSEKQSPILLVCHRGFPMAEN